MHSAKLSGAFFRRRRRSSSRNINDDFQDLSLSSSSRPSTQESKRSYSRLSTDSGAGSLEDFNNRRNSSPIFCREAPGRRHTAPIRKNTPETLEDMLIRPNTVHAWGNCSPRCSLSKYAPLPAIGSEEQRLGLYDFEKPAPVRRQCFMGAFDIDGTLNEQDDVDDDDSVFKEDTEKSTISLAVDSDIDSDFDEAESLPQGDSDVEDSCSKPKRTIIRSETFTIERDRPTVRGPFLTVAVRLPDGNRVTEQFDCKETLQRVCDFALEQFPDLQATRWLLVTTDVPKRTFKNLTMSLKEADIDDKTLLHLQCQDDSDSD